MKRPRETGAFFMSQRWTGRVIARIVAASEPTDMDTRPTRWGRAVLLGILAEIGTIVAIVLTVTVYNILVPGRTEAEYAAFGTRVGAIIGLTVGTLLTLIFARVVIRSVTSRFYEHGLVVAAAAVALQLGGSLAGHGALPKLVLVGIALKLGAGVLAGWERARIAPVGA